MAEPSPWVYTTVEVTDPPVTDDPSPWVYVTVVIPHPHMPIAYKTPDGLKFTRRLTKTLTGLK